MDVRYLRRELAGRTKQTVIVAAGLAVAIALVMIVSSLSAGVRDAQDEALESVYGVGTDLAVTGAQAEPGQGGGGRGERFDFGEDAGETGEDGTTSIDESQLRLEPFRSTLVGASVATVAGLEDVSAASGALSLTHTTFSGELPERGEADGPPGDAAGQGGAPGGFGGGSFGVDSFTVLGVDTAAREVGPLSAAAVDDGRLLEAADAGSAVAVLDAAYATSAELAVGDIVQVAGEALEVVGIVSSTSADADTAADVYLPLDVAQDLADAGDVVSTVYVQAASSGAIETVQAELEEALPEAEVSSQSDLASSVSGSLASASSLVSSLGTWLSVVVLAVALALAVLFTISGVSRRTREFGTLKALGWSDGRVVRQVAGESLVQGLLGGAVGLAVGFVGIAVINLVGPTVSASAAQQGPTGAAGGPAGRLAERAGEAAQSATEIVLQAPVTPWVVLTAVGVAVAGGLLAGAFGGWRAARLSPAEALRSVA